jgi:hypothetical protein
MFALFNMFLFFPRVADMLFASRAANHDFWIQVFPPAWFLGIYETMLGSTRPIFRPLAGTGVRALVYCAVAAALAYGLSYARVYRRSFEESESAAGPGLPERALEWFANALIVRKPLERQSNGRSRHAESRHQRQLRDTVASLERTQQQHLAQPDERASYLRGDIARASCLVSGKRDRWLRHAVMLLQPAARASP